MQVKKQCSGGCQGFLEKILPGAQRRCGDFFSKNRRARPLLPVSGMAIFAYSFFSGKKNCTKSTCKLKTCVATQIKSKVQLFSGVGGRGLVWA
jgi:hypothetical protein